VKTRNKVFLALLAIGIVIVSIGFVNSFQTRSSVEMGKIEKGLAKHPETRQDAQDRMQNLATAHLGDK
jgi:hypothetical protein